MTLEINETSKMIIEMGDSYRSHFIPTKENLIVFRGVLAIISPDY